MTTTTDLALLRRAVLLDPGSDDARLVFADAIEESGGANEQRWAEMIRAGCELAKCSPDCGVGKVCRGVDGWLPSIVTCAGLRDREDAIIRDLTTWLRRGERCGRCRGKRIIKAPDDSDLVAVSCPTCHGTGWLGSLIVASVNRQLPEYDLIIPATFSRGFVSRVELTADQVQDTGFLARLFSEWPVTEAGLIGKEPHEDNGYFSGPNYRIPTHDWWRNSDDAVCDLPDTLFDEVSKRGRRYDYDYGSSVCEFHTAADAVAVLSRAIVSLGREAAGLPQLEEVRS